MFTVEMIRGAGEHFDCSYSMWSYMLSLAQSFGWMPVGTLAYPGAIAKSSQRTTIKSNYDPERSECGKWLSDPDARNLAGALWRAATAIHEGRFTGRKASTARRVMRDGATQNGGGQDACLTRDIEAFANYCQRGEFRFAFGN